ncbi:hypothetical protein [Streptomyces sp. NBC_00102]|uniref:hypothetical protein n=1 Tax=Streptomyces sp. NBC_00102 TaxID=2975652 RepID=UPI00224E496E|nr:hypothetical protein [Streptomyces sp. NBC_00102]MCX5402225.1 hypothetical protein [Streptomyces sp. NBC_00102]
MASGAASTSRLALAHVWITRAIAADETRQPAPHHHLWRLDDGLLTDREERERG